jgi:CHASE2 domain-containing sensor protein
MSPGLIKRIEQTTVFQLITLWLGLLVGVSGILGTVSEQTWQLTLLGRLAPVLGALTIGFGRLLPWIPLVCVLVGAYMILSACYKLLRHGRQPARRQQF